MRRRVRQYRQRCRTQPPGATGATVSALTIDQLRAYASAVYEVETAVGWIDVRDYARARGEFPLQLISACNPWSQPLSDAANARRTGDLRRRIEASGCRWKPARGRSPDSSWIEPGFLVQADDDRVDAWARHFQQHAVLVLRERQQLPALRLYSPLAATDRPEELANMRLEWVGCAPPAPP